MATLYFNAAVDNDWNEVGNWWTNSGHTSAASGLPTSSDSVVLSADVTSNGGSTPTVVNLTTTQMVGITITVTGTATFTGTSARLEGGSAIIAGNAVFQNGGRLWQYGYVTGNATFHDTAYAHYQTTVDGNVTVTASTFSDSGGPSPGPDRSADYPLNMNPSAIGGTITFSSATPVVFNCAAFTIGGKFGGPYLTLAIPSVARFTAGAPTWNLTGNIYEHLPGNVNLSGGQWRGNVSGNLTLSGGAQMNQGTISGNATFDNSTFYHGVISGSALFQNGGVISGDTPFGFPSNFPVVYGTATFRGSNSYAAWGDLRGDVVFDLAAAARTMKQDNIGNATATDSLTFEYGKGVNGSSILGVV